MKLTERRPERYLAPCLMAALTLAGCGGGSGGGGSSGPPPSFTVGGAVSGLIGTGLVVRNNGGDDLAVPTDGSIAFSTKIASGATYSVTVSTQPTSPAQTCMVSNGGGTMGSTDVTDVAVSCTIDGAFTGFVSGPYLYTDVAADGAGSGPDVFDGAGGFTDSYVLNSSGVISSGSFLVPYTAAAGGAMKLGGYDGGVSADGSTLLFANLQSGTPAYVDVDIRQGQTNFANTDFSGSYQVVSITSVGDSGGVLTLTADGAGSYSGTLAQSNGGVITSNAVSGTYSVAAGGALIMTPASGSPLTGGISADGNTLVLSQLTAGQPAAFAVGVKQGQTSFTNADVVGTYKIIAYGNSGQAGGLLTLYFDGAGLYHGTDIFNFSGSIEIFAETGTYTVAADGAFTMTPDGGSAFTGGVSSDGNTLVFAWLQAGRSPEADVGVRM